MAKVPITAKILAIVDDNGSYYANVQFSDGMGAIEVMKVPLLKGMTLNLIEGAIAEYAAIFLIKISWYETIKVLTGTERIIEV